MSYYIKESAKKRFKKWLVEKDLNLTSFAKRCGCSRQYLQQALNGDIAITPNVSATFKKGGYELL